MTKTNIIMELMNKGYKPAADSNISPGDTVYKYTLPSGITERIYILESNTDKPFWGMTYNVVKRLCTTNKNFFVVFLSTNDGQSFVVNKEDIARMFNDEIKPAVSTDKNGNYKLTANDMPKINAIPVDDIALTEFIREQL